MRRFEGRGGFGDLPNLHELPRPQQPPVPRRGQWRGYLPLALLVAAGTLIAGVTLVRILGGVGRDRVRTVTVPGGAEAGAQEFAALKSIDEGYVEGWIAALSSEELGGRDTPSRGLDLAQERVAAEFRRIGLVPASRWQAPLGLDAPLNRPLSDPSLRGFFAPFSAASAFFGNVPYESPEHGACLLEADGAGNEFQLYADYVPLTRSSVEDPIFGGEAYGEVVFAGFGIDSDRYGYDDFRATDVEGKIAVVLAGEPEGAAFDGAFGEEEASAEACVWNKLDALQREGAIGALVVEPQSGDGPLDYHWTRAYWNPPTMDKVRGGLPTLRVTEEAASRILGSSVAGLRARILQTGTPLGTQLQAPGKLRLLAGTRRGPVELRNVVGWLPGEKDGPFIVVGAHLDHIGVGPRGRIGRGADDNASGVAAMLAVATALASDDGRARLGSYSVLFCAFTGEEDGRIGSAALVRTLGELPAELRSDCSLMINLDMVGGGDPTSAVVLGLTESPTLLEPFHRVVERGGFGLDRIQEVTSKSFFLRSDHYSFYEAGIPALFLFEAWPHEVGVYHTWRDVPAGLSSSKVTSIAQLATLVAFETVR